MSYLNKGYKETVEYKLGYISKKVKFLTRRPELDFEMNSLICNGEVTADQAIQGVLSLTKAFVDDDPQIYSCGYDINHAKEISDMLNYRFESLTSRYENERSELSNIKSYLKKVEFMITSDYVSSKQQETSEKKLSIFLNCLHTILNHNKYIPNEPFPFEGTNLKVSPRLHTHSHSVLITPEKAEEAIVILHDDKPRKLFAEYGQDESAEAFVSQYYGSDGAFALHYRSFLDCRNRYPNQKQLFL